jgi:uncharacterized membrane protein
LATCSTYKVILILLGNIIEGNINIIIAVICWISSLCWALSYLLHIFTLKFMTLMIQYNLIQSSPQLCKARTYSFLQLQL